MKISLENIRTKLAEKGLKVTPQRISILEAVYTLNNHPTAENIKDYLRKSHPNIATGTIYKVLETLVEKGLINKVKTDRDIMRYDGLIDNHHHLYCSESDRIEDFIDDDLDELLKEYFKKKSITSFNIEELVLQIRGTFD